MGAGPIYVMPGFAGRAGFLVSAASAGNFGRLISEVRKAEAVVSQDIRKIQEIFTLENTGKLLLYAIREELFRRIEKMNTQSISEVSNKVITNAMDAVKSHLASTTLAGLGISSLIVEGILKQRATSGKTVAPHGEFDQHEAELEFSLREKSAEQPDATAPRPKSAMEGISNYMEENPLMIGFIGLSAGLVLGVLTRDVLRGNQFMEETLKTDGKKTAEAE